MTEQETIETAEKIAAASTGAYSYDRWGHSGYVDVAVTLLTNEYTPPQIIGLLHHRDMRWAADALATREQEEKGHIPASVILEFLGENLNADYMDKTMFETQPTIEGT